MTTADGSFTLHSARYGQTYHSVHGAITEAEYVYLEGGGVLEAMQARQHDPTPAPIAILEVGLGLGVNALVSAKAALHHGVPVNYVGIEHDFQPTDIIRPVLRPFPSDTVDAFCSAVKMSASAPINSMAPARLNSHFQLHIVPTHLSQALDSALLHSIGGFDALYLDAFSPDTNPECWTADILAKLSQTLAPGGRLTTYCAKGSVRRALLHCGLSVSRRPGPPGKRECLVAHANAMAKG